MRGFPNLLCPVLGSGSVSIRVAGVERSEPPDAANPGGSQNLNPSHPHKVQTDPLPDNQSFLSAKFVSSVVKDSDGDFVVSLFPGELELEFVDADEGEFLFGQFQVAGRCLFDNDRDAETQSE